MKPLLHANLSVKKYGGVVEDYLPIHNFIDSSKAAHPDVRHRAILHSAFGCYVTEQVFGVYITNTIGKRVSVRDIAENHVQEDVFIIPTMELYLKNIKKTVFSGIKDVSIMEHAELDATQLAIPFDDAYKIHTFMESSYIAFPDKRHNTILHTSFGLQIINRVFGDYIMHESGKYSPMLVAKRHIMREMQYIPSVTETLEPMLIQQWMSGSIKHKNHKNIKHVKLVD